jgi:hypothetical protein
MSERIFGKVFVGGGKTIGRLPDKVASMLDSFMESGEHIIVGDAHGCDLAFQIYLHSKEYPNVTVYCSGEKCRFNMGAWKEKHIAVPEGMEGYEFYREKDLAMMGDCDCALLVYERRSLATRSYIYNLKALGKPVFAFNVERDCFKISRRK